MTKNRLLAMLMLAVLLLLSACGSLAPAGGSSAGTSTSGDAEAENAGETSNGEPVELTFWHSMDGVFAELLQKQVDQFNNGIGKEKQIKVTPVFQDWPGTQSLTAAMASDDVANMPDVIQLYGESVSIIRDYERTVWLEDYMTRPDAAVKKQDLIPNAVSSQSINGKMIGVPYNVSSLLLYYNKDLLNQAGYDAPPATIAEMAKMIKDIKGKTNAKYGLNVQVNQYELENWIATQGSQGTYFGNNDSGHSGYLTELMADKDGTLKNFLTEWKKVIDSGAYKAVNDSISEEFASGDIAMVIMSSSRIPKVDSLVNGALEWDVSPIPTVSGGDVGGAFPSGAGLYMLDRDREAKDAAWQFVQYMISPEAQTIWLDGTGYIPVNVHAVETDAYKQRITEQPKLEKPYQSLIKSTDRVVAAFVPNSDAVGTVIKDTMLQFADGQLDVDGAHQAMVNGIQKAFTDYYRINPVE